MSEKLVAEDTMESPNVRVVELVEELSRLYGQHNPYNTEREISKAYILLREHCRTFADFALVVDGVKNLRGVSTQKNKCLRKAVEMCPPIEAEIIRLLPHFPGSWIEEKKALLRKAVTLTKDKTELVELLEKLGII